MSKVPPPPRVKAPISEEQLAIVKKKISAPSGPRPANISTFKSPKKISGAERDRDDESGGDRDSRSNSDDYVSDDSNSKKRSSKSKHNKTKSRNRREREDKNNKNRLRVDDYEEEEESEDEDRTRSQRKNIPKKKNHRRNSEDEDDEDDDQDSDKFESVDKSARGNFKSNRGMSNDDPRDYDRPVNKRPGNSSRPLSDTTYDRRHDPRNKSMRDDEREGDPDEEAVNDFTSYDDAYGYGRGKPQQLAGRNPMNGGGPPTPTGMKAGIFNFKPILHSTYRELRAFVLTTPPPGLIVRCYIERDRNGSNMLTPFYSLCADLEDGTGRELMVCKKVLSRSAHYVFSLKSDDLYRRRQDRSRLYLGKLRATNTNEYILYDSGLPEKSDDGDGLSIYDHHDNNSDEDNDNDDQGESKSVTGPGGEYRQQMAVIYFNTKTRPVPENLRGMEVCVPVPTPVPRSNFDARDANGGGSQTVLNCKSPNIQQPFQQIRDSGRQNELLANKFFVLHEKQSKYDPLSSCLVDFKGRANIASVKNFQLVESTPETGIGSTISARVRGASQDDSRDVILLQMGKATDQCFNLDFRAPLTMLQAFAISIARYPFFKDTGQNGHFNL